MTQAKSGHYPIRRVNEDVYANVLPGLAVNPVGQVAIYANEPVAVLGRITSMTGDIVSVVVSKLVPDPYDVIRISADYLDLGGVEWSEPVYYNDSGFWPVQSSKSSMTAVYALCGQLTDFETYPDESARVMQAILAQIGRSIDSSSARDVLFCPPYLQDLSRFGSRIIYQQVERFASYPAVPGVGATTLLIDCRSIYTLDDLVAALAMAGVTISQDELFADLLKPTSYWSVDGRPAISEQFTLMFAHSHQLLSRDDNRQDSLDRLIKSADGIIDRWGQPGTPFDVLRRLPACVTFVFYDPTGDDELREIIARYNGAVLPTIRYNG